MAKGRIEGLGAEFEPGQMDEFDSAKRLRDNVGLTSWRIMRLGLTLYCNFMKKNPDEIVADREKSLSAPSLIARRKHEDIFTSFSAYVQTLRSTTDQKKKLAPNTINSKLVAVKSFYEWNGMALGKVKAYSVVPERQFTVPTQEELGMMLRKTDDLVHRALILAEAQSGISEGDLLGITWSQNSANWGTVEEQLAGSNPYGIVHLHFYREKTKTVFDSFFGKATVAAIKDAGRNGDERIFPISKSTFQRVVKDSGKAAQLHGDVTPHCLRKFFNTTLKTERINDPAFDNDLVEYWMGHSLGKTRSAYLAPPPLRQAELYVQAEPRLTPA